MIQPMDDAHFSMALLHEATDLAQRAPQYLTDLHLRHVAVYDGGQAELWARKRDAARERLRRSSAPPPAPALPANVARLPTITRDTDFGTDDGLDAWAAQNPTAAVPVRIWRGFVVAAREKRQRLEARVAELELRLAAFETAQSSVLAGATKFLESDSGRIQ